MLSQEEIDALPTILDVVERLSKVENDALFVVFNGPAEQEAVTLPELKESTLLTIDTPWDVTFCICPLASQLT